MASVKYSLRDDTGATLRVIEGSFEKSDELLLRNFVAAMGRVRATELLRRGLPAITGMKLGESGLVFTCTSYGNSELYELLHVLRPVMLSDEATSFEKIAGLLKRRFADRVFSDLLKRLRRMFEHGELSLYLQFGVGSQPLFHRSTLDTWLNGVQYHTDAEKAEAWAALENVLQLENSRALVMNQLHSRVKALMMLESVAATILDQLSGG